MIREYRRETAEFGVRKTRNLRARSERVRLSTSRSLSDVSSQLVNFITDDAARGRNSLVCSRGKTPEHTRTTSNQSRTGVDFVILFGFNKAASSAWNNQLLLPRVSKR